MEGDVAVEARPAGAELLRLVRQELIAEVERVGPEAFVEALRAELE